MTSYALLWIMFGIVALVYASYGCLLMYHWFTYAHNQAVALIASLIYSGAGSIALALFAAALL